MALAEGRRKNISSSCQIRLSSSFSKGESGTVDSHERRADKIGTILGKCESILHTRFPFWKLFGVSCILTKKVGKIKYYCPKFQNFHIEVTLGGGELSFTEGLWIADFYEPKRVRILPALANDALSSTRWKYPPRHANVVHRRRRRPSPCVPSV